MLSESNNFDMIKVEIFVNLKLSSLRGIKDMQNKIDGTVDISKGVFADIVGYAALECYGIVGVANANRIDTFMRILPVSRLRRGVNIEVEDDRVDVEVYVVIEYGTTISTICDNLTERIKFVLKEFAGVDKVNVKIKVCDVNVKR